MTNATAGCKCQDELKEKFQELDQYLEGLHVDPKNPRRKDTLINALHQAQEIFGHLPEPVQIHIAQHYSIPHADVSGVISFYNYLTVEPKGKIQVNVCMGTACYVNGAEKILREFERVLEIKTGEVSPDGKFSIESLRCVGACGLAPVVTINHKVYGKVKVSDVKDIIESYLVEETDQTMEASNA